MHAVPHERPNNMTSKSTPHQLQHVIHGNSITFFDVPHFFDIESLLTAYLRRNHLLYYDNMCCALHNTEVHSVILWMILRSTIMDEATTGKAG